MNNFEVIEDRLEIGVDIYLETREKVGFSSNDTYTKYAYCALMDRLRERGWLDDDNNFVKSMQGWHQTDYNYFDRTRIFRYRIRPKTEHLH